MNPEQRKTAGVIALMLIGIYLVAGSTLALSTWNVSLKSSAAFEEALQWRKGRLDVEHHRYEVAGANGRNFNVVGLAFTIVAATVTSLFAILRVPSDHLPAIVAVLLFVLPIPLMAFWAMRRSGAGRANAALLTVCLFVATPLLPVLRHCQNGDIYYLNHAIAVTGLLLFCGDLLGARRVWPAILGLMLAVWSRQSTIVLVVPLAIRIFADNETRPKRRWVGVAGLILLAAVPLSIQFAKFGNPLETGYGRLYDGRTDPIAQRAHQALFSPNYVPMQARAMNTALPRIDVRAGTVYLDTTGVNGASIWLTSPIVLAIFFTARRWWKESVRRSLMLASFGVVVIDIMYHTTGSNDAGYYRYALDYIPIWLVVVGPFLDTPRFRWFILGALGVGALYFCLATH